MWVMSGPHEEDVPFDDLDDAERDEITTPQARRTPGSGLTLGSDIHDVPPPDAFVVERKPLDALDAVLVAYLLDLDDVLVDDPIGPDDSPPEHVDLEATKPERPWRGT
jgi:hypothetical protein